MSVVTDIISAIRNLRHESNVNPAAKIHAILAAKKWAKLLEEKRETIMRLAKIEKLEIAGAAPKIHPAITHYTSDGVEIILPLKDLIDVKTELKRITEEKNNLKAYIASMEAKLGNKNFVKKAPQEIVKGEREKLALAKEKYANIEKRIRALE